MANIDVRVGISAEVKNELIPSIEHAHFLGYDEEERIVLYTMAAALATHYKMLPKPASTFTGLVRMRSVPDDELTELLLMYLANEKSKPIDELIDDIGVSRRKEIVQFLNQVANAGFMLVKEKLNQQEDVVIAEMFCEMDETYQKLVKDHPEFGLPAYHTYGDSE